MPPGGASASGVPEPRRVLAGVDIRQDASVVHGDLDDLTGVRADDPPGAFVAPQSDERWAMLRGESDRMSATTCVHGNRDRRAVGEGDRHSADRLRPDEWHVAERDDPSVGIRRAADAAGEAPTHAFLRVVADRDGGTGIAEHLLDGGVTSPHDDDHIGHRVAQMPPRDMCQRFGVLADGVHELATAEAAAAARGEQDADDAQGLARRDRTTRVAGRLSQDFATEGPAR